MRFVLSLTLLLAMSLHAHAKKDSPNVKRDPAAINGSSSVVINENFSFLRVEGDSAKALYEALTVPAKNNQGEAGPNLYFKNGKSYRCFLDTDANTHTCDITIKNPAKGIVK